MLKQYMQMHTHKKRKETLSACCPRAFCLVELICVACSHAAGDTFIMSEQEKAKSRAGGQGSKAYLAHLMALLQSTSIRSGRE